MFLRNYWYVAASAADIGRKPLGRIILQGRAVAAAERKALDLPSDGAMISLDRNLVRAIKDML